MMRDRKKWIRILDQLWLRNSRMRNYYRMATAAVKNEKIKRTLLEYAVKRANFSFELDQQRELLSSQQENRKTFEGSVLSLKLSEDNLDRILRKIIKAEKESVNQYSEALARVNNGNIREILIRHRAGISIMIRELLTLSALLPFPGEGGNLKSN